MLNGKDAALVFETLLASPGMNDEVKISLRIPRKNVLLLSKLIEIGLSAKDLHEQGLFSGVNGETTERLKELPAELLDQSGLSQMNEKLNSLQSK
jgi:hypothetical protein